MTKSQAILPDEGDRHAGAHIGALSHLSLRMIRDLKNQNEKYTNASKKIEEMDSHIADLEIRERALDDKNKSLGMKVRQLEQTVKETTQEANKLADQLSSGRKTMEALTVENKRITEEVFHHKKTIEVAITEKNDADKIVKNQATEIVNLQHLLESSAKALNTSVQWILRYAEVLVKLDVLKGERDKSVVQSYSDINEHLTSRTLSENILISAGIPNPFGTFPFEKVGKRDVCTSVNLEKRIPLVNRAASPINIPPNSTNASTMTSDSEIRQRSPLNLGNRERSFIPTSSHISQSQSTPRVIHRDRPLTVDRSISGESDHQNDSTSALVNLFDGRVERRLLFSFFVTPYMKSANVFVDTASIDWEYKDSGMSSDRQPSCKRPRFSDQPSPPDSTLTFRRKVPVQRAIVHKNNIPVCSETRQQYSSPLSSHSAECSDNSPPNIPLVMLSSESETEEDVEMISTTNKEKSIREMLLDASDYSNEVIKSLQNLDFIAYDPSSFSKHTTKLSEVLKEAKSFGQIEASINFAVEFLRSRNANPLKRLSSGAAAANFFPIEESAFTKAFKDLKDRSVLVLLANKIHAKTKTARLSLLHYGALCRVFTCLQMELGRIEDLKKFCFRLFLDQPAIAPLLFANMVTAFPQLWNEISAVRDSAKLPVIALTHLISVMSEDMDEDLRVQAESALQKFYTSSDVCLPETIVEKICTHFTDRSSEEQFFDSVTMDYVLSMKLIATRLTWLSIRNKIIEPRLVPLLTINCSKGMSRRKSSAVAVAFKLMYALAKGKDTEGYALGSVEKALLQMKRIRKVPLFVMKEAYYAHYHLHLLHRKTVDETSLEWLNTHDINVDETDL